MPYLQILCHALIQYSKHYTLPIYFLRYCKIHRGDRPTEEPVVQGQQTAGYPLFNKFWVTYIWELDDAFFSAGVFYGVRWMSDNECRVVRDEKRTESARIRDMAAAPTARKEWKQRQRILGNEYNKEQIRTGCLFVTTRSIHIYVYIGVLLQ